MRPTLYAALALLGAPAIAATQAVPAEWSGIIQQRRCHSDQRCDPRVGLVWNDSNPIPDYPPVMRDVGISGNVLADFVVRPDGRVDPSSVAIAKATNRAFEQWTVDAIREWRFGHEAESRPTVGIAVRIEVIYVISSICTRDPAWRRVSAHGWGHLGQAAQMVIIAPCQALVPRDSVRPLNRPGG